MRIVHFCAGLEEWNGMANTARQFVEEQQRSGHYALLTNSLDVLSSSKSGDVDEVYIHGAWLPVLWKVAKLAKRKSAKLYICPAGSYDPVRLAYHGWKKRLVSPFEHRMLRSADVLLATREAEKGWIQSYVGNPCPPIILTDLKRFFKLNLVDHVEQVDGRPLHLLYLGRRHPLKGLEYLEAVWNTYYNICSNERAIELRIESSVFGEELEKVWDWCDVLVLPTLSENFGRVVAEALERGKCVITTDGAPAWGDGNTYGGRLIYLKGYRYGTDEDRVRLLKESLTSLIGSER